MNPRTDPAASLGANIRRRRQSLGLSLDALARESRVSSTMLSEVERSVKNPTVKLAYQIARALGCTLTDLLEDEPSPPVQLTRAIHRQSRLDPVNGVVRHILPSPLASANLEITWFELPPMQATADLPATRGGAFHQLIAVRGHVALIVDDKAHELLAGDSIVFVPQHRCYLQNVGDMMAETMYLVDSPQHRSSAPVLR